MTDYVIFGAVFSSADDTFQEQLEAAHQKKHYPRCLCKDGGVEMYVSRIGNQYFLKRMPNQGRQHSSDCDSYEIPDGLSGKARLQNSAIIESHETGLTLLKLGFPLSKGIGSRPAITPSGKAPRSLKSNPVRLSMRALLEYLYEEGGLSRWSPRMMGKRSWFIVRRQLLDAAQNKVSKKTPVAEVLFVPETFSVDKKEEIAARRRRYFANFKPHGGKTPLGLMIGEVKEFGKTRVGGKIIIKHMPDMPLQLPEDLETRIHRVFEDQIAVFEEDEKVHLIFLASFLISGSGNPQADEITFITVDENWLPFENLEEREMLARLVSDKRFFVKAMRYDVGAKDVIASAIITDTQPEPTVFYIAPVGSTEEFYDHLDVLIEESGAPSYIWDINAEMALMLPSKGGLVASTESSSIPDNSDVTGDLALSEPDNTV